MRKRLLIGASALLLGLGLAGSVTASQSGGLPALSERVAALETLTAAHQAAIDALTAENLSQQAAIDALTAENLSQQAAIDGVQKLLRNFSLVDADTDYTDSHGYPEETIRITGANLQIVNDSMSSSNGLGNLVLGYNRIAHTVPVRSGSHVLVVGQGHSYEGMHGIVAGYENWLATDSAVILGGFSNLVSCDADTCGNDGVIVGGVGNDVRSRADSVLGGYENIADGGSATIAGGSRNEVYSTASVISGGRANVIGADTYVCSISGGAQNRISGNTARYAHISGGLLNVATGDCSAINGGRENQSPGINSAVSGGYRNVANGATATVGGGANRSCAGSDDWVAGALFQDN